LPATERSKDGKTTGGLTEFTKTKQGRNVEGAIAACFFSGGEFDYSDRSLVRP